jgi:hypothetical protein
LDEQYGSPNTTLNADLTALQKALSGSAYTSAQRTGIYNQEAFKVHSAISGPADQAAIQAAQMNLDAAQQMGDMPVQLKVYQDAFLAAERKYYEDTQKGTQLATSLRGLAQQGQVYAGAVPAQ